MSKLREIAEEFAKVTHPNSWLARNQSEKHWKEWEGNVKYFLKAAQVSLDRERTESELGYLCGLFYRESKVCGCEDSKEHIKSRGYNTVSAT